MPKYPCRSCEQLREQLDDQYQRAQSLQESLLESICRARDAEERLPSLQAEIERLRKERVAADVLIAALEKYVDHFGDPLKVARPALAQARGGEHA